jgi:DNA-binding NarL/FixJ family response regulator
MPKQPAKQRIILVDDHEVVRLGLKSLLERHPQFDVIAEASSAREAIEKTDTLKPDVVVMDIRLPGTSGIEACEQIVNKHPNIKVIMLTSYAEDEMLFSAIRAGASGYILKQIGSDDLVKALEAVSRGEALLDPAVTQRVFQEVRRAVKEEEASAYEPRDRQAAVPGGGHGAQLRFEHPLETGCEQPCGSRSLCRGAQSARIYIDLILRLSITEAIVSVFLFKSEERSCSLPFN